LSPRAAVLRDLHHGPAIMQFLNERRECPAVEVPAELRQGRADRVLVHRPAADGGGRGHVEVFSLNELTRRLIESFDRPRPWSEAVGLLGALPSGGDAALPGLLSALLAQGVLCPASGERA
jgi:hypothetical protein